MPKNIIDLLIKISEEKIVNLMKIQNITEKQGESIKNDNIDSLQDLIKQKQDAINRIAILDSRFENKYNELKETFNIQSPDEIDMKKAPNIARLKSVVNKISELLEAITNLEVENRKNINKNYEAIKAKLKRVKKGKQVTKGYNKYKETQGPTFFNKRK